MNETVEAVKYASSTPATKELMDDWLADYIRESLLEEVIGFTKDMHTGEWVPKKSDTLSLLKALGVFEHEADTPKGGD